MTTRKKVTDQAKPPAKRARKKADPDPAGGLFSEGAEQEAPPTDSEIPHPDLHSEIALIPSPASIGPEPSVSTGKLESSLESLESTTSSEKRGDEAAQPWLLATNHLNLLYMLADGLLMGPAGFFGKHYRDPSSELSGQLPVFRGSVPDAAIQQAISEQKHLRPCIAELDLAGLMGSVGVVSHDGVVSSCMLPLPTGSDPRALLIRAPLPMTLVKRLVFRSSTDRKEFEAAARSFANIDLSGLCVDVSEGCFNAAESVLWPLPDQSRDITQDNSVDRPPARGQAIGGCLAMLYHLANRSDLGCSLYRLATGAGDAKDSAVAQRDPVLAELVPWIDSGGRCPESSMQARLYWGAVHALVDARLHGLSERPVDVVLGFLEDQVSNLQDVGYRSRLEKLIADMRSTFGLGGGTITQLFEHHKGTLSRPLLLFCLRERCVDLLEFSHPDLSDEELVLAAILFGVRDGWRDLPVEMRAPEELSRFVQYRMFEVEFRPRNAGLSLVHAPRRPIPLGELVTRGDGEWTDGQTASLANVVGGFGWHDCIVSRIRLSQGQYRLNVSAEGVEVVVRGGIQSPTIEIDKKALLKKISQWPPLPRYIEGEVRAVLDSRD